MMRKTAAYTALAVGILLIVVPRFILPACEYAGEGFARMHCSDTMLAEMLLGALLAVLGGSMLAFKSSRSTLTGLLLSVLILIAAWFMPDLYGYCANRKMPCHYGMVPGVRFIVVLGLIVQVTALIIAVRSLRKKTTDR